jgi:hypothetical protein
LRKNIVHTASKALQIKASKIRAIAGFKIGRARRREKAAKKRETTAWREKEQQG